MTKISTILFDLDGTLIDTNEIIAESYQYTFNKHFPNLVIKREKIIEDIGPPLREIFSHYTSDKVFIQQMIDTYRKYYIQHEEDKTTLYPGVYKGLTQLKELGCKMGIVTSKGIEALMPSLIKHEIKHFFDVIIALDDVVHPKPHPEPVLKALSQLSPSSKSIMIGDNQSDILSGKNAGIISAGVAWSIKGIPHLKEVGPDFIIHSMDELITLVKTYKED